MELNKLLKLNLQFFAEGEGDSDNPPGDSGGDDKGDDTPSKIELTEDELKKKIESESDRKLNSVLDKKEKEWKANQDQAIKDALAEHQRLSKLSEKEQQEEKLTQKEKELADKEAAIARKELRSDAVDDLQKKELPSNFADFLLADDVEGTLENINTFKQAFDEAVNAAVKEKLRQDTPPVGGGSSTSKRVNVKDIANKNRLIK